MNIALIAHAHHAIKQPFVGGLEAHTHSFVHELQRLGHTVTTYAKYGTDDSLNVVPTFFGNARGGNGLCYDLSFKLTMQRLKFNTYDLIINNSLSHIPLMMHTPDMPPMITIFHTPPLPRMVPVLRRRLPQANRSYLAVSAITAQQWQTECGIAVKTVENGIDVSEWSERKTVKLTRSNHAPLTAIWSGRITAEKGTHIAMLACQQLGIHLKLAGSVYDQNYFASMIMPLLDDPRMEYLGHMDQTDLDVLYSQSDVALVTPLWDEPFGLVAIEALACGVPVAALANGALPSIIDETVGALAINDSPEAFANAIMAAVQIDPTRCRPYVEERYTLQKMVAKYMEHADTLLTSNVPDLQWQTYP